VEYQLHTKLVGSADTFLDLSASLGFSRELMDEKPIKGLYSPSKRANYSKEMGYFTECYVTGKCIHACTWYIE